MADPLQNADLAWGFPTDQALNVAKELHGWRAAPWVSQHRGVHLTNPSFLKRSLAAGLGYQQGRNRTYQREGRTQGEGDGGEKG